MASQSYRSSTASLSICRVHRLRSVKIRRIQTRLRLVNLQPRLRFLEQSLKAGPLKSPQQHSDLASQQILLEASPLARNRRKARHLPLLWASLSTLPRHLPELVHRSLSVLRKFHKATRLVSRRLQRLQALHRHLVNLLRTMPSLLVQAQRLQQPLHLVIRSTSQEVSQPLLRQPVLDCPDKMASHSVPHRRRLSLLRHSCQKPAVHSSQWVQLLLRLGSHVRRNDFRLVAANVNSYHFLLFSHNCCIKQDRTHHFYSHPVLARIIVQTIRYARNHVILVKTTRVVSPLIFFPMVVFHLLSTHSLICCRLKATFCITK